MIVTQDQDRTDENSLEVSYVTTTSHALLFLIILVYLDPHKFVSLL